MNNFDIPFTRRQILKCGFAGATSAIAWPVLGQSDNANRAVEFTAEMSRANILSGSQASTEVWSYNNLIPGPVLRIKQGQRVQVVAQNKWAEFHYLEL